MLKIVRGAKKKKKKKSRVILEPRSSLVRALHILIISEVLSCHSFSSTASACRSRFHGLNLACILLKSRIASDFFLSGIDM